MDSGSKQERSTRHRGDVGAARRPNGAGNRMRQQAAYREVRCRCRPLGHRRLYSGDPGGRRIRGGRGGDGASRRPRVRHRSNEPHSALHASANLQSAGHVGGRPRLPGRRRRAHDRGQRRSGRTAAERSRPCRRSSLRSGRGHVGEPAVLLRVRSGGRHADAGSKPGQRHRKPVHVETDAAADRSGTAHQWFERGRHLLT